MTIARELAAWSASVELEDVPAEVREAASLLLIDGWGCALAAARRNELPFLDEITNEPGPGRILGSTRTASVSAAAMANGMLIHALDFDDTHPDALVHTTSVVLPAALAVGEQLDATGAEFLDAAITGFEMVVRLGAAVTHGFHARGFHATSVCGVFAAALIAAKLSGLDEEQTTNALGIAGSLASGSLEFLEAGTATKALHPGFASMNGILAARAAAAGAEGPASIFEGRHGLYSSFLGATVDPTVVLDGLGSEWRMLETGIKPFPCCQLSHASLEAIRAAGISEPGEIAQILFEVPQGVAGIVCGKPEPRSAYEAKFSLEHCAAIMILDGDVTVESFDAAAIARAKDLSSRVTWRVVSFEEAPASAPGACEIQMRDGSVLSGAAASHRGLDREVVLRKFFSNGGTEALAAQLLSLGELSSIREVSG